MAFQWKTVVNEVRGTYEQGGVTALTAQFSDWGVALAVALMAALMVVPLPTWLLDILLTLNITVAVFMLMTSVYISAAPQLAAFPTLLLITTLYRLALDISATRLILLDADAGEVIQAFGNFVVGGDFIVGAVIFLIIALVQFIVIAKGAERVGEVAARFTLDAIPGKQMLIESDLRAGAITHDQARSLRQQLNVEMQFYSRMEGSMRFIKGDAIAGLIISAINIGAGFLIGVAVEGMPLREAAQTYTILTIGNGLVSQIPALLISISAGVLISRVSKDDSDSNLGRDLARQLLAQPRALVVSAIVLLALALVPGLPKLPFLLLAGLTGGVAFLLFQDFRREPEVTAETVERQPGLPMVRPLVLRVSEADYVAWNGQGRASRRLQEQVEAMLDRLYAELGISYPPLMLEPGAELRRGEFQILINEIPFFTGGWPFGKVLVHKDPKLLMGLHPQGLEEARFEHRPGIYSWIDEAEVARLASYFERAGISAEEPPEVVLSYLADILRRNRLSFIGLQEVKGLLNQLEKSCPILVEEAEKNLSLQALTKILRRLLEEEVSIRDLKSILEFLLRAQDAGLSGPTAIEDQVELLRQALRDQICFDLCGGGTLRVYEFGDELSATLRHSVMSAGLMLSLRPGRSELIAISQALQKLEAHDRERQLPVIVVRRDNYVFNTGPVYRLRRQIRDLIVNDLSLPVVVISDREISPLVELVTIGIIEVRRTGTLAD